MGQPLGVIVLPGILSLLSNAAAPFRLTPVELHAFGFGKAAKRYGASPLLSFRAPAAG
jgi:hypothetical protein